MGFFEARLDPLHRGPRACLPGGFPDVAPLRHSRRLRRPAARRQSARGCPRFRRPRRPPACRRSPPSSTSPRRCSSRRRRTRSIPPHSAFSPRRASSRSPAIRRSGPRCSSASNGRRTTRQWRDGAGARGDGRPDSLRRQLARAEGGPRGLRPAEASRRKRLVPSGARRR